MYATIFLLSLFSGRIDLLKCNIPYWNGTTSVQSASWAGFRPRLLALPRNLFIGRAMSNKTSPGADTLDLKKYVTDCCTGVRAAIRPISLKGRWTGSGGLYAFCGPLDPAAWTSKIIENDIDIV